MLKRCIAACGAGRWGKNIIRNLDEMGLLFAVCDLGHESLQWAAEKYPHVLVTSSYDEILDHPMISAVTIATPAITHYEMAKKALEKGKDVFVEKPLCFTTDEGETLVALAKSKGLILMVGHLLHFHPCIKALKDSVREGRLGSLRYISSHRLSFGPLRSEENALWNFAPHDVSVILSLVGAFPKKVISTGRSDVTKGVYDLALTTLEFSEDLHAHVYVSWINPFKEQKLTLIGTEGLAVFDDTKPWGEKLLFIDRPVMNTVPAVLSDQNSSFWQGEQKEPLREELSHFFHCCSERIQPITDGEEALNVIRVLEQCQQGIASEKIESLVM